jgi:hypothetical protein
VSPVFSFNKPADRVGYVYEGVNSDKTKAISNLKWKNQLTRPDQLGIEDVKVPLQAYPYV